MKMMFKPQDGASMIEIDDQGIRATIRDGGLDAQVDVTWQDLERVVTAVMQLIDPVAPPGFPYLQDPQTLPPKMTFQFTN